MTISPSSLSRRGLPRRPARVPSASPQFFIVTAVTRLHNRSQPPRRPFKPKPTHPLEEPTMHHTHHLDRSVWSPIKIAVALLGAMTVAGSIGVCRAQEYLTGIEWP